MRHTEPAKRPRLATRGERAILPRALAVGLLLGGLGVAPSARASLTIVSAEQVLLHHTDHALDGALLFVSPSGARLRLVTDIHSEEIANPGDGSFHPMEMAHIGEAVDALPSEFVAALDVTLYVLPYPRAACPTSSTDGAAVYLSPFVVADPAGLETARVVTHELGHCVQAELLPDSDVARWEEYSELREIDEPRFHAGAAHRDRPHEIFAEDFRALFGGPEARGDGSIENGELTPPAQVAGLAEFFLELLPPMVAGISGSQSISRPWILAPNPARPGTEVRLLSRGDALTPVRAVQAQLFDAAGRSLALCTGPADGGAQALAGVSDLPAGAYWVRVAVEGGAPGDAVVLPLRIVR